MVSLLACLIDFMRDHPLVVGLAICALYVASAVRLAGWSKVR